MKTFGKANIQSIIVKDLFGFLSYEIPAKSSEDLIILYGDNGCGKTTLLNLVFHALAPEDSRGHRSYISRIPLKELHINFVHGHKVSVCREQASQGPFTMKVEKDGLEIATHKVTIVREGQVGDQEETTYRPLIKALANLGFSLFLLPDNRKIQSSPPGEDESLRIRFSDDLREFRVTAERAIEEEKRESIDTFVQQALTRATHWTRQQALTATSQGETDTNKIYQDILRRISGKTQKVKGHESFTFDDLLIKAESIKERSLTFSRFGLVTPLEISDLLRTLQRTSGPKKGIITQVLSPYVRSLEVRLNALEQLRDALTTFSEIFSKFYNYKTLTFDIKSGIVINLKHNSANLRPEFLSSGEKQLLLLFCNLLLARSNPSIFIIDEPELSLNIKWQRELISSLMSCIRGCDIQFLLATHSIEMIALHKSSAVRLGAE